MAMQKIYIVQTINLYKDENGDFIASKESYFSPYLFTAHKKAIDFINKLINEWIKSGYKIEHEPENLQESRKAFMITHWSIIDAYEERKMVITLDYQYPL